MLRLFTETILIILLIIYSYKCILTTITHFINMKSGKYTKLDIFSIISVAITSGFLYFVHNIK